MYLTGGFSQLTQGFSASGTPPQTISSFYIGIIPMVQLLLAGARGRSLRLALRITSAVLLLLTPVFASRQTKVAEAAPPDLLMDGGRKLSYERSFSSEREVKPKRGFWNKLVDVVAGEPNFHYSGPPLQRRRGFPWTHHRDRPRSARDPHLRFHATEVQVHFACGKREGSDALPAMRGSGRRRTTFT